MTTPTPPPADPTAAPHSPPPPTTARRSRLPWILAAAGAVLLLAVGAVAAVLLLGGDDLDRETAQRECRTALEREADRRADNLGGTRDTGVLVSVAGVELQETWETDTGWSVNGSVQYNLTTPLIGRTDTAVSLTCEATAADGRVRTTVKNRA